MARERGSLPRPVEFLGMALMALFMWWLLAVMAVSVIEAFVPLSDETRRGLILLGMVSGLVYVVFVHNHLTAAKAQRTADRKRLAQLEAEVSAHRQDQQRP